MFEKNNMTNLLSKVIRTIFLGLLFLILITNMDKTLYIFNGWYVSYNETPFKYFLIALFLVIGFLLFKNRYKLCHNRKIIVVIWGISSVLSFYILKSFNVQPAGDSWAMIEAIYNLVHNDTSAFQLGGYISRFPHQLGGVTFWLPFVSIFKYDFAHLYFVNFIILRLSILFFILFVANISNNQSAFLIAIFLSFFVPTYFYQFLLYSDTVGLLLMSLIFYVYSFKGKNSRLKISFLVLLLIFSILVRENLIILILALILIIILFEKCSFRVIRKIAVLISILIFSTSMLTSIYDVFLDTKLNNYALPSNVKIAVGLSGAGNTAKYYSYFAETGNNKELVQDLINEDINNRIAQFKNISLLGDFLESKFSFSWSDQDFDSLSYILPFNFDVSFDAFRLDNDLRNGRSSITTLPTNSLGNFIVDQIFTIRNFEKIFLMFIVMLAIIGGIINFNASNRFLTLLELFIIGTSFAFLVVETQPRYLLFTMCTIIIYASITMSSKDRIDEV